MERRLIKHIISTVVLIFISSISILAQTAEVNAGKNQIINWVETHSAQLKGEVSQNNINVEWTCPQNSEVVFKDASNPVTEVTFPRSGYYLLYLSDKEQGKNTVKSSVIINVFKPHSYKQRLSDLINLMTVDEKIKELTNEADAIPRLGLPKYNYWSEALHGVLAGGATSFPQGVAMGSTWEPGLIHKVASVISDELSSGKALSLLRKISLI